MNELFLDFEKAYLEVCRSGYSVLGRSPAKPSDQTKDWHRGSSNLPGYAAYGKYRFLKTLQIARKLDAQSILEVAAGGGFNGVCLYEEGKRVVLNDMRFIESEIKQWPLAQKLEIKPGNLFELDPEVTGKFDLVLACEVIEHVSHGDQFVLHLKKFLNPGGKLLITTPNGAFFRSTLPTYSQVTDFKALESRQFQPDADGHLYLYTPEELEGLMRSCGLDRVELELFVTPWISGSAGLRFLPSCGILNPLYLALDRLTRGLGHAVRRKMCTQIIAVAGVGSGVNHL